MEYLNHPKSFNKSVEQGSHDQTYVHVDLANFDNRQSYTGFTDEVSQIDDDMNCGLGYMRKSIVPEPFIQIVLSNLEAAAVATAVGLWAYARVKKFINHTVDESLQKVCDDLSDRLSAKIISVFGAYKRHQSQDERSVVTQIDIPGDVDLILLTRTESDADFQNVDLKQLHSEVEKYGDLLQEADSVTFGREGKGNWELLHMTTVSGKVIGTSSCFERTMRLLDEIWPSQDSREDDGIEEK